MLAFAGPTSTVPKARESGAFWFRRALEVPCGCSVSILPHNSVCSLAWCVFSSLLLPPFQIVSHFKNFRKSIFTKFDQIYMIK